MKADNPFPLLVILGPTATGKTRLAALVAQRLGAEVISADSRQIYRRMDIGTGKDYSDYIVNGEQIPYHLIDIAEPGTEYNVFEFQKDFTKAWQDIQSRGKKAILCGGTGLYIDSVIRGYRLHAVPPNEELRAGLEKKSLDELTAILSTYKKLHNTTDVDTVKRAVRAIEIAEWEKHNPDARRDFAQPQSVIAGISCERELRRERITRRLKQRLDNGLVEEVEGLIESGISHEAMIYYGLEYKYVTEFIQGKYSRQELFTRLETAIHQFAKRQMTYFRGMERKGTKIYWVEGKWEEERKVREIVKMWDEVKC